MSQGRSVPVGQEEQHRNSCGRELRGVKERNQRGGYGDKQGQFLDGLSAEIK